MSVPAIVRSTPTRTSLVCCSMTCSWLRPANRCAAARTIRSVPPTLTTAMLRRVTPTPDFVVASSAETEKLCDARDSRTTCSKIGLTNVPPPMTTRWPDRSVVSSPVSGLITRVPLLRPVMMSASSGVAILKRTFAYVSPTTIRTSRAITAAATVRTGPAISMGLLKADAPAGGSRSSRT